MVLIGLTGTHGAGKGTITDYLCREHGFSCFSVSEFLAEEAQRRGVHPDRVARGAIANEYRSQGSTALMEAVLAAVPAGVERIVLEPQYTADEVRFVQEHGGVVLAIDADIVQRYKRVHVRGSAKDDVSFEEFRERQEREMTGETGEQNLADAMAAADVHMSNDTTREALEAAVREVLAARGIF